MNVSLITRGISDYWTHAIKCSRDTGDKVDMILASSKGKVLHVGCTDYPLNAVGTLHNRLINAGVNVDGYDVDSVGIEKLRELHPQQKFFSDVAEISENYDLIIIPEVLEHVTSHDIFFEKMNGINFDKFLLSVPNALYRALPYGFDEKTGTFFEVVHPDHKCWYSPYTITFLVESIAKWKVEQVMLMHNDSQVVLTGRKTC